MVENDDAEIVKACSELHDAVHGGLFKDSLRTKLRGMFYKGLITLTFLSRIFPSTASAINNNNNTDANVAIVTEKISNEVNKLYEAAATYIASKEYSKAQVAIEVIKHTAQKINDKNLENKAVRLETKLLKAIRAQKASANNPARLEGYSKSITNINIDGKLCHLVTVTINKKTSEGIGIELVVKTLKQFFHEKYKDKYTLPDSEIRTSHNKAEGKFFAYAPVPQQ